MEEFSKAFNATAIEIGSFILIGIGLYGLGKFFDMCSWLWSFTPGERLKQERLKEIRDAYNSGDYELARELREYYRM